MTHWAYEYIGRPWVRGGQGPDVFDCLGLVVEVQRNHFGVTIPTAIDRNFDLRQVREIIDDHRHAWTQVSSPIEGDVVLMARRRVVAHIGVWISANGGHGVLHCAERIGVMFSKLEHLSILGWSNVTYYRRTQQ